MNRPTMNKLFNLIETAFVDARDHTDWSYPISATPIVEALVDAGYLQDTKTGDESIEAGVLRAYTALSDKFEGEWPWHTEDVALMIAHELGLGFAEVTA